VVKTTFQLGHSFNSKNKVELLIASLFDSPLTRGFMGSTLRIFFSLGNVSHSFLDFCVTSIFVSIVGHFFGTWFLPMVFYFRLRN
jgi:hypothetical protein